MDDRELLWRQYELSIDMFKHYLKLTVEFNVFFYGITGAVLSYYFAHSADAHMHYALLLPFVSFKTYRIESNVVRYPAFAICAAYRAGAYLKAESFVLVQASDTETTSMAQRISFSNNAGPDCPVVFDEAFALEEALRQAEVDFSIYIHERNLASSAPLTWPKKQFTEIAPHRLVGVWAYSPLNAQLARVRDVTQCEPLGDYLNSFRSLPTIKLSPLAL